jgi:WD40 repeat protein
MLCRGAVFDCPVFAPLHAAERCRRVSKHLAKSKFSPGFLSLLIRDINARQLLPDRIDWLGAPHRCSVDDLARRYSHVDTARRLPALLQEVLLRTRAPSLLADIASQAAVARAARPLDLAAAIRGRDRRAMPYVYSQLSRIKTFCGHGHPVYCVTFDNVGARVITGSDDTNVKVWSVTSGALLGVLRGHKSYITDTSVSPDNQLVAAGAVDGSIRVWQLDTFAPVAVLLGHKTSITSVAFSPCGRFLLSSAVGCVARVWRTDADFEALPTLFYDQIVQRPRLTRTLSNAIDAAALMHASLFGAGAVRAPQPAAAAAAAAAFGPESMHTREPPVDDPPVASNTPAIALFGLAGCVFAMVGYPAEVASSAATAIAVDDDSSSSSSEPIVGIAQRRRDRLAAAAAASARERAAAVAAAPRKKIVIRLFNIDVLSCVCELVGHSDEISTMRFPSNPTRAQLCSGSDDGTVRVWSFGDVFRADAPAKRTGASVGWRVVCMEGAARAAGRVNSVVWAVDDQRVVAVHEDCVLRVWDAHSGALRHELRHHTDDVFALTANPGDSTVVLSGGHDGSVAVWDVLNGVLLKEIRLASDMPAGNRVLDGSFAAAGDMLVVSNFYGEAMLFGFGAQPQQLLNRYPTEQFLPDESQPLLYDNFGWCVDAQTRVPPHLMARRALIDFAGAGHDAAVFDVGTPAPFVATAAHRRRIAERQAARSTAAACVRRDFPGLWAGAEYSLVDATPPPAPRWTLQNTPSGNVGLRVPPNRSAPAAAANARNNNARAAQALRARSRGRPRRSDHAPVVFLPTPPTSDDDDSPDDGDGGGGFDDEEYHGVDESESDVPDDADDDDDDDSAATRRRRRRARAEAAQVARQFAVRELPQRAARSSARSYRIDADEDGDDDDASADTRPARRRRVGGGDDEDEFNIDGAPSSVDEDEVDGVRYPDWMQLAVPPAAPGAYFPQVGDVVVYFPQGHYDVIAKYRWRQPADMPVWVTAPHFPSAVLCTVMECVSGRDDPVFFIDVLLRPCATEPGALPLTRSTMRAAVSEAAASGKAAAAVSSTSTVPAVAPPTENFVVRHVPMAEFECLVPRAFVERALRTPWADGTRVRSYLHDTKSWMTGAVLSIAQDVMRPAVRATVNSNESVWRSVQVQWDGTNAIENVSPWELEPATPDDAPPPPPSDDEPPRDASPEALRLLMLRAHGEPRGDDIGECEWLVNQRARMLHAFDVVCSAEVARIFLDPVDLSEYRKYALYVTAPMCVRLIRDRIANMWYRRRRAIVDDMDKLVVASCVFNSESHELTQRAAVVRQMCFAALDIITPTIDYDADSLPLVVPALALAATRRFDECQTTRAVTKSIVERAFATNEELAAAFPERYKLNILNRPRNRTVPRSSAATLPQSSSSQRRDERRHERNHVISSPSGVRPRRAAASAALAHGFGDRDDDGSPPPPRDHSTSGRRIRIPVRLHPGDGATATVPSPASQQQRLSLRDETRAQFAARTRPTNVIRISRSALAAGAAAASSGAPPAAAATSSTATAAAAATAALAIPVTRTRSVWNEDAQLAWALQQSLNEAGSSKRATRAASSQQPEANVTAVVDDDDDDDDKQKSKKSKKSKKAKSNVVVVDDDEEEDDDSEGFVPTPKKKPTSQRRQVDSDEESFGANADDDDDDDDDDEESEEEAVSSGRSKSRSKRATARTRRNYSLDDDVSGTVSSEDSADTRPKRGRGRPRKLPVAAAPTSDGPAKRRKKAKKDDSDDDDDDDESGGVSKRKARRTALVARRKVRQRSRANDGSDDFEPD